MYANLRVMADTTLAIPELARLCRAQVDADPDERNACASARRKSPKRHAAARAKWASEAREDWDASPITLPRLASEVWQLIKDEDWVLTANTLGDWTRKLWTFDKPYRHPGKSIGTATQIGISLGVALAHRDDKRLVIDLQPDGDLMFDGRSAVGRGQA
jgi:acetolactate synthase-1/2/3 large subunit